MVLEFLILGELVRRSFGVAATKSTSWIECFKSWIIRSIYGTEEEERGGEAIGRSKSFYIDGDGLSMGQRVNDENTCTRQQEHGQRDENSTAAECSGDWQQDREAHSFNASRTGTIDYGGSSCGRG
jgi:hypothetical protein